MPRLSAEQLQLARTVAQQTFDWELLAEEHYAVLRQNMNEYAAAYEEVERHDTPSAFPRPDQLEECMASLERTLEPKAVTAIERVRATHTLMFLSRLSIMRASENFAVGLEVLRMRTALQYSHRDKYVKVDMVLPPRAEMHPYLAKQLGLPPFQPPVAIPPSTPAARYPIAVPADAFTSASVQHTQLMLLTPEDVMGFRQNPDPLVGCTYLSPGHKYFKLAATMLIASGDGREKLFYVVFADNGPEAVCYSSDEFFGPLESSSSVMA
ncbi:hypothetical protein B0H16DRAFT_622284 [Mycena metata]|uniref:Uncharacterized protein n=1 Tax=Mycena metata TaxID=1033252 RepID=A0AAD7KC15_9AGAR|nr:hypothetical protein B0H16DRAFT_622284 [Mycena metata]